VGNGGSYDEIRTSLLASYGADGASRRDGREKPPWKVTELAEFLARLRAEGCRTLRRPLDPATRTSAAQAGLAQGQAGLGRGCQV
jgi:hypothetical protein